MNNKWTLNEKSVQCNLLIFIVFGFDWTLLLYFAAFLLLSIGGGVLWWQWTLLKKRVQAYQLERNALRNDFYEVLNLRFPTTAVVVWTSTQAAWLVKMNVHYASGRMAIIQLKRSKNENAWDYYYKAEEERNLYNLSNRERITEIERQRSEWLDTLDESGFLDYFKGYHYGNWEASKKFLEEDLDYFRKSPLPVYLDFRKKKVQELERSPQLNK